MSLLQQIVREGSNGRTSAEPLRVLGIDLGTTNSTIAEIVFDPTRPEFAEVRCLPVEQPTESRGWWNPLVPSIVALHDGREIVGEGARRLRSRGRELGLIEKGSLFAACKNDMGLKRTYHMAPNGYRTAAEVSGRLLSFLHQATLKDKPLKPARTTVTVPASFQAAQRHDTLKAARLAQLSLQGGDLLDEPVAAFIGYLCVHPDKVRVEPGETKHLMVFDFGGGTCDVAILRLARSRANERLTFTTLAVSRYHRLGGADIDQAIVYEVLLPQLLQENNLRPNDIDFDTKKNVIEPAFIGVAEELKAGLCEKFTASAQRDEPTGTLVQTAPGEHVCTLPEGGKLVLTNPRLTSEDFATLLAPFLELDVLCLRETEYRQTLSIFTPIRDALDRSGLDDEEIDLCLLAGGSCLIPMVVNALEWYFPNAELLTFANADASQTAVARGAAVNALSLALCGQPVIQPVCQETIAIVTSDGPLNLVPKGAPLPWPADGGYQHATTLALPCSSLLEPVTVRVEVVAREETGPRPLFSGHWQVPPPVAAGERITLAYRYDENQVLELRLCHAERDDVPAFQGSREHPLTHMVNPLEVKLRIEETEEKLRTGQIPGEQRERTVMALAEDCAELRQYEKAIARLSELLRRNSGAEAVIINKMAIYWGSLGDLEREEHLYREAIKAEPKHSTPWFNLALLLQKQKRLDEAKEAIDHAIRLNAGYAPYYVLQAQIVKDMGKTFAMEQFLDIGQKRFRPLAEQSDWELHWYQTAAELREDGALAAAARLEKKRRTAGPQSSLQEAFGTLPALVSEA